MCSNKIKSLQPYRVKRYSSSTKPMSKPRNTLNHLPLSSGSAASTLPSGHRIATPPLRYHHRRAISSKPCKLSCKVLVFTIDCTACRLEFEIGTVGDSLKAGYRRVIGLVYFKPSHTTSAKENQNHITST